MIRSIFTSRQNNKKSMRIFFSFHYFENTERKKNRESQIDNDNISSTCHFLYILLRFFFYLEISFLPSVGV